MGVYGWRGRDAGSLVTPAIWCASGWSDPPAWSGRFTLAIAATRWFGQHRPFFSGIPGDDRGVSFQQAHCASTAEANERLRRPAADVVATAPCPWLQWCWPAGRTELPSFPAFRTTQSPSHGREFGGHRGKGGLIGSRCRGKRSSGGVVDGLWLHASPHEPRARSH